MKELNSALGDALAGFDDFQNDTDDSTSMRQEETTIAAVGPIKLKLKMFGKTSPGKNPKLKKITKLISNESLNPFNSL